ncbi:MAG: VCBS repeat-containing protein [Myxococcales bacterium]|nr:VCBS repeat-containing protein [Myxococcales bacterium]
MDLPASSVVFWRLRGTRGVTAGTRTSATWLLHTPAVSAPHATAGLPHVDVNGDGFDDIVLGAANATVGGQAQTGEVRVFHGGPGGPTVTPNTVLQGRVSGGRFGIFVANVGDVNGDGFGEVVVLSTTTSNVFVFGGSSSGLGMDPLFTLDPMLRAGSSPNAAAGGDFNGDGYSDIVISWSRAPLTMGSVVFVGAGRSTPTISPVGGVMVVSSQLFSLGDVDGDELADVGSWSRHVAFGHRSTVLVSTEIAGLGSMVSASGGDANGDGYFDAFVSDGFFNPRIALGGSAFARSRTEVTVRMPASWLGVIAVLGARDVDDDGRSELVMLGDVGSGMRELSVLLGSSGAFADVASDRIRDTGSGRSSGGLLVNLAGRQRGAVLCDPTRTAGMLDFAGGCRAFTVVNAGVRSPAIWAVDGTRAGEELGNSTAQ